MSRTYFGTPPSNEAVALQDTYLDLLYMAVETEHLRWVLRPRVVADIGRPRGTCCRMEALVRRHRAATDRDRRCTRRPRRYHLQISVPQPHSTGLARAADSTDRPQPRIADARRLVSKSSRSMS